MKHLVEFRLSVELEEINLDEMHDILAAMEDILNKRDMTINDVEWEEI